MKPEARKLHKAINNNNVFRAVRFTCVTAWESEPSKKSVCSAFPNYEYYTSPVLGVQDWRSGVLACKKLSPSLTRNS